MSHSPSTLTPTNRIQLRGVLHWSLVSLPIHVLVVSGADDSFIDIDLVKQINVSLVSLPKPKEVLALDGHLISTVTHCTAPISLTLSGSHTESIELFVIPHPPLQWY